VRRLPVLLALLILLTINLRCIMSEERVECPVRGGFRWGIVFLVVFYVVLVSVAVYLEIEAREVVDYAREMEANEKYEVAYLAYRTVAKKWTLSYSVSEAIVGISRIDADLLSFDLPDPGVTFFERLSGGRFSSYHHYGLPLATSVVCFAVGSLMVLVRVFALRSPASPFFLIVLSGLFFVVQAVAYGWISVDDSFLEISVKVMESHGLIYVVGYALLVMTAFETLCGKKK